MYQSKNHKLKYLRRQPGYIRKERKGKSLSRVRLFVTPWTVDYQASQSMGSSRQESWSGLPFPSPGDLPDPGIEPGSPTFQADALPSEPQTKVSFCKCDFHMLPPFNGHSVITHGIKTKSSSFQQIISKLTCCRRRSLTVRVWTGWGGGAMRRGEQSFQILNKRETPCNSVQKSLLLV